MEILGDLRDITMYEKGDKITVRTIKPGSKIIIDGVTITCDDKGKLIIEKFL